MGFRASTRFIPQDTFQQEGFFMKYFVLIPDDVYTSTPHMNSFKLIFALGTHSSVVDLRH